MSEHLTDVKLPASLPAAIYDDDLWVKASDVQRVLAELRTLKESFHRAESARVAILAENEHYKREAADANTTLNSEWFARITYKQQMMAAQERVTSLETFIGAMGWTFDGEFFTAQPSGRYTIEPHGDGHALYSGRDDMHHGWNLARITEATPETLQMIERALNARAAQPPEAGYDANGSPVTE